MLAYISMLEMGWDRQITAWFKKEAGYGLEREVFYVDFLWSTLISRLYCNVSQKLLALNILLNIIIILTKFIHASSSS